MTDFLTCAHLHFHHQNFNYYVRFGNPQYRETVTKYEAYEYFSSGAIFGYIRWEAGQYGTTSWRFFVLCAGDPNTQICKVPGITPGAEVLLKYPGKPVFSAFSMSLTALNKLKLIVQTLRLGIGSRPMHALMRLLPRLPIRQNNTAYGC